MARVSLATIMLLRCLQAINGQYNSALAFYFREGFRAPGAQLVEAEFRSPSLINCNLRCLRSDNCVATNFQLPSSNGGGHCQLLLPHDLDDENDSIVLSKQFDAIYTRIMPQEMAKNIKTEKTLRVVSESDESLSPPLALDVKEADQSERLASGVPARTTEKEEANSTGLPVPFQSTIIPSYPTVFKEKAPSTLLTVLKMSTTRSLSSLGTEGKETNTTCSIEDQPSNATEIGEIIGAESSMLVGSNSEKSCFITTSFGSKLSTSSGQNLLTSSGVVSFTELLPHRGMSTSSLHAAERLATSVITVHTMGVLVNEMEYSTHVPSTSLQSVYELSTLAFKCSGYSMFKTCYAFLKSSVSWAIAKTSCESSNGQLVIINSSSKLNSLKNWLEALNDVTSSFHVGIYKSKDSNVEWVDGQTVHSIYSYLYTTSAVCSNNDCCGSISFSRNNFYMLDDSCNNSTSYICQWRG